MGLPGKQGDQGVKGQLVRADNSNSFIGQHSFARQYIHTFPSFFFIRGILVNKDFRGCLVSLDQR